MYITIQNNEIYHHGIKGMRWGVRRYQNYDGSYTKRGLARYGQSEKAYNDADLAYKNVKSLYKETKKNGYVDAGDGNHLAIKKSVVKEAKGLKKAAKKQLEKDYKQLSRDAKADKGKDLYRKGNTISSAQSKAALAVAAINIGNVAAHAVLNNSKYAYSNAGPIISAGLNATAGVLSLGVSIKALDDSNKLRAYYAH